ncbi:MAG: TrmH family RNA methyltransferase, partial [Candidatus Competibacteraceae bacterium]|nr:TrmH family RNA methyltransferase [Candidatus Competibacteraceae bacterium]
MRSKRERARAREEAHKRFLKQLWRNRAAPPGLHPCILVLDHLKPNFNIGKIIRSADAFGVQEVHIVGTSWFDPVPAKGSFKWVPVRFYPDFAACYGHLSKLGYTLFVLDPAQGESLP